MSASLRTTATVLLVLALGVSLPFVFRAVPFLAPRMWLMQLAVVALPLIALGRAAPAELGLSRLDRRGLAVMLGGTLIMPLAFLLSGARPGVPALHELAQGVVLAALAEEMLFRGYAFRQLHVRGGWPFFVALAVTGAVFGVAHLPRALATGEAGNAVMTVLVTGAGGAWFAWLFSRWFWCLWVPIAVHAAMNLWWHVFSAGPTAGAGGAAALWGRVGSIALITVLTIRSKRCNGPLESAAP